MFDHRHIAAMQQNKDALVYATRLACSMWSKHYRQDALNWQPADNLIGVLSQIDNMLTGMGRTDGVPEAPAPASNSLPGDRLAGWLRAVAGNDANTREERDAAAVLLRGLDAPGVQAAVPAGYKLVPIEPTVGMLEDGLRAACFYRTEQSMRDLMKAWAAMLAAAPSGVGGAPYETFSPDTLMDGEG